MAEKRPHIIIFNPDQMRGDSLHHAGNPAAITPFLDEFASTEGVSFERAFCQNGVCVPSRCSFFTGLYPHVHGHRTMSHLLHRWESNMFLELKNNGYYVWMNDRNDLFAGQDEEWLKSNADEIFYSGQVKPAPGPIKPADGDLASPYTHYIGKLGLDENGRNYTSDDESVDAAIERIKNRKTDQPLCMFLGLMYPHVPYQAEEPYYSAIDRSKIEERVHFRECSGKSLMLTKIREYEKMETCSEEDWLEIRSTYLAMCMKIDDQFKRLCDALKEAGIYDDCAIFFLSDHGDYTGDYDVTEKAQSSFEDCIVRVPLLIKPPVWEQNDPGCTKSLVELVDFYATVMDYAHVDPGRTYFGRSLRPVIEDRSAKVRDFVLSEGGRLPGEHQSDEFHSQGPNGPSPLFEYYPKMKAQSDDTAHAKGTMIRTQEFKYVTRITGEDEFYDLRIDPRETTNRIDDPEYANVRMELAMKLLKELQRTSDVVPQQLDKRFTSEMLWNKVKWRCPKEHAEEVKDMIFRGETMGKVMLYVKSLQK